MIIDEAFAPRRQAQRLASSKGGNARGSRFGKGRPWRHNLPGKRRGEDDTQWIVPSFSLLLSANRDHSARGSGELSLKEAESPQTCMAIFAHHHMIVNRNADSGERLHDLPGHRNVGFRGCWVAAWMIMHHDDS